MADIKFLAIDDDPIWLEQIPLILEDLGQTEVRSTIDDGLQALTLESFDVILLDLNFDSDLRTGLDVFRQIHASGCGADVIVISGETNTDRLIDAFNAGVSRFIPKPANPSRIRREVAELLQKRELRFMAQKQLGNGLDPFLGKSRVIHSLRQKVESLVAANVRDILLCGETGTGKEVLARWIARRFDRSGRFLPVHCGALADGLVESELFGHVKGAFTGADKDRCGVFEAAAGGTVFLDEIGEMPLHQQAKLLRVLQERKVQRVGSHTEVPAHFRSISATHVDLDQATREKTFREDLYFRISQGVVTIPSLRERLEDIPVLVHAILNHAGIRVDFTPQAITLLQNYNWPGNIRQLETIVRNLGNLHAGAAVREKDVCAALPASANLSVKNTRSPGSYAQILLAAERKRFEEALVKTNGFRDEAALLLGLSRATFFRRAKELGLIRERRKMI